MKIIHLLDSSSASEPFRQSVLRLVREGRPGERISFNSQCPPVKVERAVAKALEEYPHLEIESIEVRGASGCEFFRGVMELHTPHEVRRVSFHWDCKWRAEQQGWADYFGFPDQGRAAREFGHDCFRAWNEDAVEAKAGAGEPVPA